MIKLLETTVRIAVVGSVGNVVNEADLDDKTQAIFMSAVTGVALSGTVTFPVAVGVGATAILTNLYPVAEKITRCISK